MRMDEPDGCNGLKPIGGETDVVAAAVVIVGAVDGMIVDGSGCGCIVAVGGGGGGDV